MFKESHKYSESEKKKKEALDKKDKESKKKAIEQERKTQKTKERIKVEEALDKFKDLLNSHDLDLDAKDLKNIEKALSWQELDNQEVEEILNKIDEIENTQDIDKYLPQEYRISKEEYKRALIDDVFRNQTITKLNVTLSILANHIEPESSVWINLFSGYIAILDKKLISIQENHIDIRNNLESIDEEKDLYKKTSESFWEKILKFFKI